MRIQGSNTPEVSNRAEDSAKAPTAPAGTEAPPAEAVVVSTRSQEIVAGGQRDAAAHQTKLTALKSALESGSYKVDYDKLADKIVSDELERSKK
jgi:flagellar biosynthesis anti-sigma factor FlgM